MTKSSIKKTIPEILTRLEKHNTHDDPIKIRARAKKNGYRVYFDLFKDGKHHPKTIDKQLHFVGTPSSLIADKEKLKIIVAIRDQKQNELLKNETGFSLSDDKDKDFTIYFEKTARNKDQNWRASVKHFKEFAKNRKISFASINHLLCKEFADYLCMVVAPNTAIVFFQILKSALKQAVTEDIILKNPAQNVTINKTDTKREFLLLEEIMKLVATHKPNDETCNAFLFSCFTGLRFSDVRALTFDNIKDGYLIFKQKKTGGNERMKLTQTALDIVKIQEDFRRNDKVFQLVCLTNIEVHLKKWTQSAGINKHITFHCSRHTFATLSLTSDIDLYTVSKLLGHRDIKSTQIYAKLIDKKKDEAIDKLPDIDLNKNNQITS